MKLNSKFEEADKLNKDELDFMISEIKEMYQSKLKRMSRAFFFFAVVIIVYFMLKNGLSTFVVTIFFRVHKYLHIGLWQRNMMTSLR